MKCPNCSFFNEVRAEFCKICGTKLEKKITNVTNTLSLDQALREKYMPSSTNGVNENTAPSEDEFVGTPAWELIPGLLVASSPRWPKKHPEEAEADLGRELQDREVVTEAAVTLPAEDPNVLPQSQSMVVSPEGPVSIPTEEEPIAFTESLTTNEPVEIKETTESAERIEAGATVAEVAVSSETTEVSAENPTEVPDDVAEDTVDDTVVDMADDVVEDVATEEQTDKLAYIPPVYESMTGFERIDVDAPPIVIPTVEEYDVHPENNDDEYVDTITKSSRDRWIIAIIVFLCILLLVLGAIIIRILWQWWHHDVPPTTVATTRRTTPTITSVATTTPGTTTNPERANPVIGQFTYDLQSYLVSGKTDFLGYMINPMDAKMKLGDLHSIGVTKTEVEDVKYRDAILYLDTWVYNNVEGKVCKRLVKWEFNCIIGEFVDVTDFKNDFVLAEDEQKRVEVEDAKSTESTQLPTIRSESSNVTTTESTTQSTTITTTAAAPTTTFDDSYFVKSGSVSGGSATESDSLSKMRMGDHGYFQRLVFDFLGEKAPVYTASIDDGGYTLNLYLSNMTGHSGQPEIASWSTMTSIEVFSNSADSLQVQMRFSEPIMINTFTIDEPGRIVIDVRGDSNWDTPQ